MQAKYQREETHEEEAEVSDGYRARPARGRKEGRGAGARGRQEAQEPRQVKKRPDALASREEKARRSRSKRKETVRKRRTEGACSD